MKKNEKAKIEKIKENPLYSPFDPQGSYTGVSENGEPPTQDADDL